jgi:hypothetical protein
MMSLDYDVLNKGWKPVYISKFRNYSVRLENRVSNPGMGRGFVLLRRVLNGCESTQTIYAYRISSSGLKRPER